MDDVRTMLDGLINDFNRDSRKREIERIKQDPEAHKLTKLFAKGTLNIRYYQIRVSKNRVVQFEYTTTPNLAGYYLYCRTHINKKYGRRVDYKAFKKAERAETEALRQYRKYKARREKRAQSSATS